MNQIITSAATALRDGGVVMFPTDTVWGIGASVSSPEGINNLYRIKHRPEDKPTAVLVANLIQAQNYGIFNESAKKIAHHFWPGAITIIVPAQSTVPASIQGKNHTVGLRVPRHQVVQELCKQLEAGIVAGSANFSGEETPKKYADINPKLIASVNNVIQGEALGDRASTVINLVDANPIIVREGLITFSQVEKVLFG